MLRPVTLSLWLSALLPAAALATVGGGLLVSAAPHQPLAARSADGLTRPELVFQFRQARGTGDLRAMAQLLRQNQAVAITWIIDTATSMGTHPSDELAEDLQSQKRAWREAYKTGFVDHMEQYYQFLRHELRATHQQLQHEYLRIREKSDALTKDRQAASRTTQLEAFAAELRKVAEAFEELGDHYYAAECWLVAGNNVNEHTLSEQEANLGLALLAYQRFLEHRKAIELEDGTTSIVETKVEYYESLGAAAGEAKGPTASITLGSALVAPATVVHQADLEAVVRPSYFTDSVHLTWRALWLPGEDGSTAIDGVAGGPRLVRTGAAEIRVEPVEGEPQTLSLGGQQQLVETWVGTGDDRLPWSFLLMDTGNEEYFHTIKVDLSPGVQGLSLYVAPSASAVYELAGMRVQIFDDNLDGFYGSAPRLYSFPGMAKGEFEALVDSVLVDGEKRAVPYSEYLTLGGSWYRLEPQIGGKSLKATPATLRTGTVKFEPKGLEYDSFLVRGTEELSGAVFDLAGAKRGLALPVGRYQVLGGLVRQGKRSEIEKAVITPPLDNPGFLVKPDEETVVSAGAPFGFDFDYSVEGEELTVLGESIVVVGAGGERYHKIWRARVEPEISLRRAGSGRGSKGESMQLVWETQGLDEIGLTRAWKPRDRTVANKFGAEVEVQLLEKKNKLFGKIESVWKAPE
jgi:hypothetical protein